MAVADDYNCVADMMNTLEFDSIEVFFGGRSILKSVYMRCERGKVTGLLGRNGCGKSTLMKIVFGSMPFEQKSVRINGESLGIHYLPKKLIGYLPQRDLIPAYLTIRKAFELFEADLEAVSKHFPEVITMFDLKPGQLSGGYLRIFEVMLILESKSGFCLLDEPFTGLTPIYVEKIKQILRSYKAKKGIVITDHMHRHVTEISDTLYLLAQGQTYYVHDTEQLVSLGYVSSL